MEIVEFLSLEDLLDLLETVPYSWSWFEFGNRVSGWHLRLFFVCLFVFDNIFLQNFVKLWSDSKSLSFTEFAE